MTPTDRSVPGVRERNRAAVMAAVLAAGRRQLATVGAAALSLRAVARETGMVSSAVYRYVASRDELLTLLITESYDDLGAAVEVAAARHPAGSAARFVGAARAIRSWAVAHPHEYALLYGSPVPGYAAPATTIEAGTRATRVLVEVVGDAARDGTLRPSPTGELVGPLPRRLAPDLARVGEFAGEHLADELVVAVLMAWTQLFGLVSFEVFGQLANSIEQPALLFDAAAATAAASLGLS
jgi:AcrR family transcriptional regulator